MKARTLIGAVAATTGGLLLAVAAPSGAHAHVSIDPVDGEAGGYTVVTFSVPNESTTTATSSVELQLPTDTPLLSVRYIPVSGWSAELVTSTLPQPVDVGGNEITEAVTSVLWTAEEGSEIRDGQLQRFSLSIGPLPEAGSIAIPAIQTYTDGEVVEWSGTGENADNPAPMLYINDEPPAGGHGAGGGAETPKPASETAGATAGSAVDVLARVFGIAGLAVGAASLAFAISRRRSGSTGS